VIAEKGYFPMTPEQHKTDSELLLAEYQEAGQMARQHAGYRFSVFNYLITLAIALVGGTYVVIDKGHLFLGSLAAILGIIISIVGIAMDRRTMQLYFACEAYAAMIENVWRERIGVAEGASQTSLPDYGIFTTLHRLDELDKPSQAHQSMIDRMLIHYIYSRTQAMRVLYSASAVVFLVLLFWAIIKRL
jgi:hypothetical protein